MSSFEIGAARPVGAVQPQSVQPASQNAAIASVLSPAVGQPIASVQPPGQVNAAAQVQTSLTVGAGTIPVDQTRVEQIRKAVQSGTYPLIPAKIGDAMVAAGLMLRKPR